jgi:hypothetical protein
MRYKPNAEIRNFLLGEPICIVQAGLILGDTTAMIRKAALSWATEHRTLVHRDDIGEIEFSKNGIKNSLAHSFYQKKIDAIPAIPKVLLEGMIIDISPDFDGKPLTNIFLAAPIQIDDEKELLVVRIRKHTGGENKFYVHDIYDVRNMAETKNMSDTFKPGGSVAPVDLSRSVAHIKIILHNIFYVKGADK